ncbi:unnamed protein product [Pleuronectes platessa]|uniref:Uncharacterized protein n=1 Tax=Pleuronectes platessa TaxID=8262 RepID=A0A9N7Y7L6_PLEPL|nr:unnamed protein product [Pleuronectes platessa]
MTQEQSGTEAETGAGLNAARAVTGVESWPDEEVWLTGRVEQRQVQCHRPALEEASTHTGGLRNNHNHTSRFKSGIFICWIQNV